MEDAEGGAPGEDPQLDEIDTLIADAEQRVAGAQEAAKEQLTRSDASLATDQESTRRFVIISLLVIYAVALLVYSSWVIFSPSTIPGYVCADQAAKAAGLCTGRWIQTTDALKDVVVVWILPVLTLAIGYYFGKATAKDA